MSSLFSKLIKRSSDKVKRGFTLLELIVVIVVMGVLAAVAIPTFSGVISRSNDAAAEDTLQSVITDAKALYDINQGSTPADWYTSFATATSELPSASSQVIAAGDKLTVNLDLPQSDTTPASTYVAAITASGAPTPSVGASLLKTQLSIGYDVASNTFGLAKKSSSGNCIFASLDTASGDKGKAWSEAKDLGSNCKASVAVLGKSSDLADSKELEKSGKDAKKGKKDGTPTTTPLTYTWTDQVSTNVLAFDTPIAINSTGLNVVGASDGNTTPYMYTSSNAGVTWTPQPASNSIIQDGLGWWITSIASSADGVKLVGIAAGDYIYTSTDSGVTWVKHTELGVQKWLQVTSSTDGVHLIAITRANGPSAPAVVYKSADSGATWTTSFALPTNLFANQITSSADGSHLLLTTGSVTTYPVSFGATSLYTSTDFGVTWTHLTTTLPNMQWVYSASASSDGSHIAIIGSDADNQQLRLYTSTDFGATWTERLTPTSFRLTAPGAFTGEGYGAQNLIGAAVAVSADGSKLVEYMDDNPDGTGQYTSYLYTSSDFGATWVQQTSAGTHTWSYLDMSGDATKLFAHVDHGDIWTATGV